MTRTSVMTALRNGITADQICSFLEEYSDNVVRLKEADAKLDQMNGGIHMNGRVEDTNMKGKDGYYRIPLNVMDQVYLWEVGLEEKVDEGRNESCILSSSLFVSRFRLVYVWESRGEWRCKM